MEKAKYRAYICCGVNCGPKGASDLVDFMEAEVATQDLGGDVSVSATGCQAHCDSGPTMVVYPGPVYYQEMDRNRVRRIIKEHLASDVPVRDVFLDGCAQANSRRWKHNRPQTCHNARGFRWQYDAISATPGEGTAQATRRG